MAARMEITEKLRSQIRELEKDKREALRRYAEQTASFEAERQALYDNEQHLKSRIQSLAASRKLQQEAMEQVKEELAERSSATPEIQIQEDDRGMIFPSPRPPRPAPKEEETDVSDGPEITALKLELSTLTTSHASLQTTVQMLQAELAELKRVNNTLQEENESYSLLLMERALNGSGVVMLRRVGGQDEAVSRTESPNVVKDRNLPEETERSSLRSGKRSVLDRVVEDDELAFNAQNGDMPDSLAAELQKEETPVSSNHRRRRTRLNSASTSPTGTPVGESLADLPITGPGLDLAAELGRAENKDILEGTNTGGLSNPGQQFSESPVILKDSSNEVEALKQEVKSLKDANKALSLYASKIIDRIIMQEGFEHVLSVDYDSKSPGPRSPGAFDEAVAKAREAPPKSPAPKTQGFFLSRSSSAKASAPSANKGSSVEFPSMEKAGKLTTFDTRRNPHPTSSNADKRNRRSMSFDWRSFSMFGGTSNSPPDKEKNLRPLTLRPGAPSLTNARKLESEEDDDDRKERERLNATMKLMGINKSSEEMKTTAPIRRSDVASSKAPSSSRFSFFGLMSKPAQSAAVEPFTPSTELTSEALERSEAEASLASLDAKEKVTSAELAKGNGSGFTELQTGGRLSLGDQWRSQRSRSASGKSHSSGASTVWSAGLRGEEE